MTEQWGCWLPDDVSDLDIFAQLVVRLRAEKPGYYVHDVKIMRRPAEPNDYDPLSQRAFTAIKATISKARYR